MKKHLYSAAAVIGLSMPSAAFAHHPLGGAPMQTFSDGLLSGIGHPILGFDHLLFVALVGIAAIFTGKRFAAPAAYIAAMLVGCLAMSNGFGLPAKETVIVLSLLVLGGIVLSGTALRLVPAIAVFAAFGLFHGSAFGDAMASQEAAAGTEVLVGYLIGLGVIQYLIALAGGWFVASVLRVANAASIEARLAGAVVAGAGLLLTLENAEGIVFGLLGWGA